MHRDNLPVFDTDMNQPPAFSKFQEQRGRAAPF